ncbi:MAG: tetratricopeptide repeat protein [Saprospiraceae bacterium]|nr:tetratricopeptide repeat protein [Saprospiraceae bacterium]MDZ4703169.1 tetratricopeptide repeat protein [Saprospiraceae bacterium]
MKVNPSLKQDFFILWNLPQGYWFPPGKLLIVFCFLIGIVPSGFGQADSLNTAPKTQRFDANKVFNRANEFYKDEVYNKSLGILLESIEDLSPQDTTYYRYIRLIGRNYQKLGYYQRALENYLIYLNWAKSRNSLKEIAKISGNISATYQAMGDFKKAYDFGLDCLRRNEEMRDSSGMAEAFYELGTLFFYQKNPKEALAYYKQSMAISQSLKATKALYSCLGAMGSAYEELGDLEAALSYNLQSLEIARKMGQKMPEAYALHNVGTVYIKMKLYDKALDYLNASLKLKVELDDVWGLVASYKYLGLLYLQKKDFNQAIEHLNDGLDLAKSSNSKNREAELLTILGEAYEKAGSPNEAIRSLRRSADLKDSILSEAIVRELGQKKESYELLKKEREIVVLTKEREISRLRTSIIAIIACFLLLAGWLLWRQYRLQRRNNAVLKEKNAYIDGQNQLLQLANGELQQFAQVASHDLREPLRTIGSFSTLLSRHYESKFDDEAKEYQGFIQSAVKRMQHLLDDLLDYARLDHKESDREITDLSRLVQEATQNLKSQIESTQTTIEVLSLPSLRVFPRPMVQLFQNLISNGIKYRGEVPPVIRIKSSFSPQSSQYTIALSDNGIGMEPINLERIFNMFVRLHGQGKYEGTGIGLATCKKIVERHGGKIWAESTPGKGSTFYFSIPSH